MSATPAAKPTPFVHKPPYPVWRNKYGIHTVCRACGRLLEGEPPIICAECGEADRAKKREQRNARKAAKAVAG